MPALSDHAWPCLTISYAGLLPKFVFGLGIYFASCAHGLGTRLLSWTQHCFNTSILFRLPSQYKFTHCAIAHTVSSLVIVAITVELLYHGYSLLR